MYVIFIWSVFAGAVVPRGVTSVITDPHEIGNVLGEEAVVYMHDAGCGLPMRQFINIPDRKSTRLNSSHSRATRMPSSA